MEKVEPKSENLYTVTVIYDKNISYSLIDETNPNSDYFVLYVLAKDIKEVDEKVRSFFGESFIDIENITKENGLIVI